MVKTKSYLTKNKQADQNDRELIDLFLKYQMTFHRGKKRQFRGDRIDFHKIAGASGYVQGKHDFTQNFHVSFKTNSINDDQSKCKI